MQERPAPRLQTRAFPVMNFDPPYSALSSATTAASGKLAALSSDRLLHLTLAVESACSATSAALLIGDLITDRLVLALQIVRAFAKLLQDAALEDHEVVECIHPVDVVTRDASN